MGHTHNVKRIPCSSQGALGVHRHRAAEAAPPTPKSQATLGCVLTKTLLGDRPRAWMTRGRPWLVSCQLGLISSVSDMLALREVPQDWKSQRITHQGERLRSGICTSFQGRRKGDRAGQILPQELVSPRNTRQSKGCTL